MFYADLHIHSKYSRATSRDCDLEHMAYWARKKGVAVLGTGDFTHPKWMEEITEKLVPAEPGLFRLRPDLEREVERRLNRTTGEAVRFMLEVEISTIYKKDDKTRKVHHLVYAPDLEKAQNIVQSLSRIGNLASDGRPILGLDSRHLLEITLAGGEGCFLIPAHIWTPWFAALGSKSGFDSIEHCYGDLASEIFAVETGLSSDPEMNWRLSSLDRFTLVSNSDAHSPPKIGREASAFDTELSYYAMLDALRTGRGYGGTVEFYPEEGKYYLDGHRNCGICLTPQQTRKNDGLCPACGKPLTLGVMHRVNELADRETACPPPLAAPFRSLVPLEEVLSELQGVGAKSKRVQAKYETLVSRLGSELFILENAPLEDVRRESSSLLAEAIDRMRSGRVHRQAGFDGEYGVIRLFDQDELIDRTSGGTLFDLQAGQEPAESLGPEISMQPTRCIDPAATSEPATATREPAPSSAAVSDVSAEPPGRKSPGGILEQLDRDQRRAAEIVSGPLLIVAGPGTGKTRTLTHRMAHLIDDLGVAPEQCLAITFTRRAADEMRERLMRLLPTVGSRVPLMTFHACGLSILQDCSDRLHLHGPLRVASRADGMALLVDHFDCSESMATRLLDRASRQTRESNREPSRRQGALTDDERDMLTAYKSQLHARGLVDFDDLLTLSVQVLEENPDLVDRYRERFRYVSVDEYQDIDAVQYRLVRLLAPKDGNLCVIGDPDQAIYGFRGADVEYFQRFSRDYPAAQRVTLSRNYRSTRPLVDAALQAVAPSSLLADRRLTSLRECRNRIEIHQCSTERAEAEFVVHAIERMIGGSTFFSLDSGRVESDDGESLSFADFAVLYRTDAQADALSEAFERSGMPFQKQSHKPLGDHPFVRSVIDKMSELSGGFLNVASVVQLVDRALEIQASAEPHIEVYGQKMRELAREDDADVQRWLSRLSLGVEVDCWDPRAECVSLLTLHAAKGLEFPVVFIAGCEDGLVPLYWGAGEDADLAEERRLFFVGMTRAQRRLIMSYARTRLRHGQVTESRKSPFLQDIQERLLSRHEHQAKRTAKSQEQMTLFDI